MAFNTHIPYIKYISGSNQDLFVYNFKLFIDQDITVDTIIGGVRKRLLLNHEYSVTIDGDKGGYIHLATPLVIGSTIVLRRELDLNRYVEYQTSGDMLATTLNTDQDYQTYLIQDQEAKSNEYLKLPDKVPGFNGKFPEPGAGEFICWNDAGTNLDTKKLDKGPKGDVGPAGPIGNTGATGAQGPTGSTGIQGPEGHRGYVGPKGDTGAKGDRGDQGLKGDDGTGVDVKGVDTYANILLKNGSLGNMWITADTGTDNQGNHYGLGYGFISDGTTGPTQWSNAGAIRGPKGDIGPEGPQGPKGGIGNTGQQGIQGPVGPIGNTGIQGVVGPTGPTGLKGDTGPKGVDAPDHAVLSIPLSTERRVNQIVSISEAEYDALAVKEVDKLYMIM